MPWPSNYLSALALHLFFGFGICQNGCLQSINLIERFHKSPVVVTKTHIFFVFIHLWRFAAPGIKAYTYI